MTAKEKSKELVDRFLNEQNDTDKISQAKKGVLICVNEFIDALSFNSSPTAEGLTEFYEKVKKEINNL